MSHKYIRVHKYKTRNTKYCKSCMCNVVQNVIQNSLYTADSLWVIFEHRKLLRLCVRTFAVNGDETAFSFFRPPCVCMVPNRTVFSVKQEWDLYMLCR